MIKLRTGITVPISVNLFNLDNESIISSCKVSSFPIIATHGLGSKNPKLRNHLNDDWLPILNESIHINKNPNIFYTARGHGNTEGWQDTAESNLEQFTWSNLAEDMIAVADYYELPQFIAIGNSMGSATSLFATIKHPERVKALIMMRPPTAWNEREGRRKILIKNANACQKASIQEIVQHEDNKKKEVQVEQQQLQQLDEEKYHYVLRGSALSDLPPISVNDDNINHNHNDRNNNIDNIYKAIKCPMLILAVRHDINHPISTAEALASHIPQAELHIAETKEEAEQAWPAIITQFLNKVNSSGHSNDSNNNDDSNIK